MVNIQSVTANKHYFPVKNVTGIFSDLFDGSLVESKTESDRRPVIFFSAGFRHRQTRQLPRAPRNWGAKIQKIEAPKQNLGAPKNCKGRQIIALDL